MAHTLIEYRSPKGTRFSFDAAAVVWIEQENDEDETKGTRIWVKGGGGDPFTIIMPYRWVQEDVQSVKGGGPQLIRSDDEISDWFERAGFEAAD